MNPASCDFPVMDRQAAVAGLGGDEKFFSDVAEVFVRDCPRLLGAVRNAVEDGNAEMLHRSAHAFKGAVAYFAVPLVVEAARKLEAMGRFRTMDEAPAVAAELYRLVSRLLEELSLENSGEMAGT